MGVVGRNRCVQIAPRVLRGTNFLGRLLMSRHLVGTLLLAALCAAPAAAADIVFSNLSNNGFFTPFDSSTSPDVRFGDSGWLSDFQVDNYTLTQIDLGLVAFDGLDPGTTDITFTFNNGDPSGLVFGDGAVLYSTTIEDVPIPATGDGNSEYFTLTVPLPNVETLGGFNNVGWSVGVDDFQYDGQLGFQCSTAFGQTVGFYTVNASEFDGSSWSLFSFGPDPNTGVANFRATIYVPEPSTWLLGAAGLAFCAWRGLRRRG